METISALTILCVVVSALLSVILPLAVVAAGKVKYKGRLTPALLSIVVFIGVFLLQAIIWSMGNLDAGLTTLLGKENSQAIRETIRACVMALIEIAGIWLLFFLSRKKKRSMGDALTFGGGYCVCANLVYSIMLVMSVLVIINNAAGKEVSYSFSDLFINNAKLAREDVSFLSYGFRSLFNTLYYTSASMMIATAVAQDLKWPIIAAFICNVLVRFPSLMSPLKEWFWGNGVIVLLATGIVTVVTMLLAYKLYREYKEDTSVKRS